MAFTAFFSFTFFVCSCKNFSRLRKDSFKTKYGTVLSGTKFFDIAKPSRWILAFPLIFFGRRIAFVVSAIFLGHFLWAQLAIQIMISVLNTVYLLQFRPLESPFSLRMELMNECTSLLLSY